VSKTIRAIHCSGGVFSAPGPLIAIHGIAALIAPGMEALPRSGREEPQGRMAMYFNNGDAYLQWQ